MNQFAYFVFEIHTTLGVCHVRKQGPSGTNHGLEVNMEDKNQVRPGIRPSP